MCVSHYIESFIFKSSVSLVFLAPLGHHGRQNTEKASGQGSGE